MALVWQAMISGDTKVWEQIYDECADKMYGYGMKMLCDEDFISDCIQDVFLTVYQKRKTLPEIGNVHGYLLSCMKNRVITELRKRSKRNPERIISGVNEDDFDLSIDTQATLEESEFKKEQIVALQDALDELSPRQKEIIYLRYYQKVDVDSVAAILGIGSQTVMNTTSKAINKIRNNARFARGFIVFVVAAMGILTII